MNKTLLIVSISVLFQVSCHNGASNVTWDGHVNGVEFAWNWQHDTGMIFIEDATEITPQELLELANCVALEYGYKSVSVHSTYFWDTALPNYDFFRKKDKVVFQAFYNHVDIDPSDKSVVLEVRLNRAWYTDKGGEQHRVINEKNKEELCEITLYNTG